VSGIGLLLGADYVSAHARLVHSTLRPVGVCAYSPHAGRRKEAALATFISLVNWTDQGIRTYKDSEKRADAFAQALEAAGGKLRDMYWTIGPYDLVVTADAPDAETLTAILLQTGALGNVRTTTLQAFDRETFAGIISRTG
jgi:uncharacterized protein with GYD domain